MEDLTERDNIELILLDAEENEIKEKENLEKLLEEGRCHHNPAGQIEE